MVQHAHGEHRVEEAQVLRYVLDTHRQKLCTSFIGVADKVAHRLKLPVKAWGRVNHQHESRACTRHTPGVVAAAAAHVQHFAVLQRREMRRDALPFPVRAPLGVDFDTTQVERSFTPRGQLAQQIEALALLAVGEIDVYRQRVAV